MPPAYLGIHNLRHYVPVLRLIYERQHLGCLVVGERPGWEGNVAARKPTRMEQNGRSASASQPGVLRSKYIYPGEEHLLPREDATAVTQIFGNFCLCIPFASFLKPACFTARHYLGMVSRDAPAWLRTWHTPERQADAGRIGWADAVQHLVGTEDRYSVKLGGNIGTCVRHGVNAQLPPVLWLPVRVKIQNEGQLAPGMRRFGVDMHGKPAAIAAATLQSMRQVNMHVRLSRHGERSLCQFWVKLSFSSIH